VSESIHAFIEYGGNDFMFCYAEVNIWRDYNLFHTLREFRSKGLPEKINGITHSKFFMMVASLEHQTRVLE
jgi:hypothetical protein